MDNEVFEIYKSLVQTPINSINSLELDSHINVLSDLNLNKFKLIDTELILHSLKNLRKNIEKCSDSKTITNAQIRKIVSIGWRYMCFDGSDAKKDIIFELHPSEFALPSHSNAFKSKPLDKKKSSFQRSFEDAMNNVELPPEGDLQWDNSRSVQSCIRHAAICVLIRLIRCTDSQIIFQYWPYLIFPGSPSLRNCIRNDSSWGVRFVALVALEELMASAKSFLNFAEKPRTAITSFTTFSETLGATILKLHDDFLSMLYNSSIPLVQQSLRCLSVLICCTPYQRMPNSLILKILKTIQPIKDHPETSIKFEFLSVLQSVLNSNTGITDINSEIDWIFEMIFGYIINSDQSIPIKVESLILLSSLCKNYFEAIVDKLDSIEAILKASLIENCSDIRMQAARTVEILSNTLQESINSEETSKLISKEDYFKFWDAVIPEVIKLIEDEQHSQLRMAGCDCLGSINENIFERLSRPTQILAITLLFTSTKDSESRVRGAAIRAITRGILEAGREEDFGLMADITQSVLFLIADSSLFVRTKAAWALSNLTDALLLNRDIDQKPTEDMPNCMYNDLLKAAVQANKDNDKVRCNIIRALGNLLHLSTPQMLNNNGYKTIFISAIHELVKNTTTGRDVKIKWNSCYAIGNMLKNEHIYSFVKEWEGLIFPCLIKSGLQCSNFKVRINASLALSSPSKREYYGLYWQPIWNGLVEVLNGTQHIEDFKEYKHRDMLVEQVCFTLAHLISVADIEDLQFVCENIDPHIDFVQNHISKCYEQVLPEKAAVFSSAIINLNVLKYLPTQTVLQS
ncbi:HEAT repeat-containing protein 6 [Chrysoperla carnea]|uniref:HEAT repeat-containing protein 6 n=1 Tax=Chrysoperla carnea TaxID=189513 RepID=UPI001D091F97|nr:HEAT repeat-containing protein 6 [Chrysoperla carnea]